MVDDRYRHLRKDAERNRQRVLLAARDLFAIRGMEASLNDVARHAGVGVGTVYRRFPTKGELIEAVFEDAIEQIVTLAEVALREPNSWRGFVFFVERLCELTVTDRGLREMIYFKVYGGDRIECARVRLNPSVAKLVERARDDGYLRPNLSPNDMPIIGLLAGAAHEWGGRAEPNLWRRYVALFLDGMRLREGQHQLTVNALDDGRMDEAMRGWRPGCPGAVTQRTAR